jgi:hypothetical protein
VLNELADHYFASAAIIVLVQDNLNIHCKASLYEAFLGRRSAPPGGALRMALHPQARQLARPRRIRTRRPSQCLSRRIADKGTLIDEIAAWEHHRNAKHAKANWHFTTADARIKLKRLHQPPGHRHRPYHN